jgi:hypothetical protein
VTERDGGGDPRGGDPLGDFQRWLMKAGARSVTKDLTGRVRGGVRGAIGGDRPKADVWDTATNLPLDEAPECAWCPVCRAARRMRENRQGTGAGLGSQLAGAGDALASVVQEAYSAFESAMKPPPAGGGTHRSGPPSSGSSRPGTGRTGRTGPTRTGPADPWEDASREPDDWR